MSKIVKRKSISSSGAKSICGSCKNVIDDKKESSIQCDSCKQWIHVLQSCSGLASSVASVVLDDPTAPFLCMLCSSTSTSASLSTSKQFDLIMERLNELAGIKLSLKSLCESNDALCSTVEELKADNKELKTNVCALTLRVKALENVKLRSQIFCKTSAKFNKEDPAITICEIGNSVGLNFKRSDIRTAVVQHKMSVNGSSVIKVEFKDEVFKFDLLKNRAKIRANFKDFAFFDVLSKENAVLFKQSKELLANGYGFVYHRSGRIFTKKNAEADPILIKSVDMVKQLLSSAVSSVE